MTAGRKATVEDLSSEQLRGARVLVRVDFNVPLTDAGVVGDDTRIRATLPTLRHLVDANARIILISHLGRPGGRKDAGLSLRPAADRLAELLEMPVDFVEETVGGRAESSIDALEKGSVLLLENTRFQEEEKENDAGFAASLAAMADVYVNDAFGAAHRAHASTAGVAEALRREGKPVVAGLLVARELDALGRVRENPEAPFVAILGGAKISGKIDVIETLLPTVDRMCIGGAMANTFFRAMNLETGESLVEEDRVDMAKDLLERFGEKLHLPVDVVVADRVEAGAETSVVSREDIPVDRMAVDIGPDTIERFGEMLGDARTVLWNGPMGVFEIDRFAQGTRGVARALVAATERGAMTVIGGGDSAAAITEMGMADRVSHLSTGGGASLEFMEGKELPGISVLDDAVNLEAVK